MGYEDNSVEPRSQAPAYGTASTHAYQEKCLVGGARWFLDDVPHDGLDTATRLAHVPAAFR